MINGTKEWAYSNNTAKVLRDKALMSYAPDLLVYLYAQDQDGCRDYSNLEYK